MQNLNRKNNKPFKIPFFREDFEGGFVFGKGGRLSVDFCPTIKLPLVEDAERGKEDVAELAVELVSLFASPPVGLFKESNL